MKVGWIFIASALATYLWMYGLWWIVHGHAL